MLTISISLFKIQTKTKLTTKTKRNSQNIFKYIILRTPPHPTTATDRWRFYHNDHLHLNFCKNCEKKQQQKNPETHDETTMGLEKQTKKTQTSPLSRITSHKNMTVRSNRILIILHATNKQTNFFAWWIYMITSH